MKLTPKEFKRFKELSALVKAKKASAAEEAELADLQAKKNEKGSNDLAWWKNYPELVKNVTNFPFNWIPGTRVPITGVNNATDNLRLGVMAVLTVRPAIGLSISDADAFNTQIRQLWLDLHRKYRGIGTYEKSDLGIAILAIDAVFESLAKFERLYGVINSYHIGNRVVPQGLKEALRISNNLEENLADFRYQLNLAITKLKQLCLPSGLSVLQSDIVALANVFKDSSNKRAFMFMFDQDLFGVYNPTRLTQGGCVDYIQYSGYYNGVTPGNRGAFTLQDIVTILNMQISALLNDDDIARICSDLLAAYGGQNVMQLTEVPENYTVEPVEDYERSLQFHNATISGEVASIYEDSVIDTSTASGMITGGIPICIYQNNNTVMCRLGRSTPSVGYTLSGGFNFPVVDYTINAYTGKEGEWLFDTWVDEPGEAEVMCGTRYTSLCSSAVTVAANQYRQEIAAYGTKVCTKLTIFNYDNTGVYYDYTILGSVTAQSVFFTNYIAYLELMQMDWHPIMYVDDGANSIELFGDVDNFTSISTTNLKRIHDVALLSGYKIPVVSARD